jgi:hypothetical protein
MVSWGGRTTWQPFATMYWPDTLKSFRPAHYVHSFVGQFDAARGAELLVVDSVNRLGQVYNPATGAFSQRGQYAY